MHGSEYCRSLWAVQSYISWKICIVISIIYGSCHLIEMACMEALRFTLNTSDYRSTDVIIELEGISHRYYIGLRTNNHWYIGSNYNDLGDELPFLLFKSATSSAPTNRARVDRVSSARDLSVLQSSNWCALSVRFTARDSATILRWWGDSSKTRYRESSASYEGIQAYTSIAREYSFTVYFAEIRIAIEKIAKKWVRHKW